jgi:hypothetical protein
VFDQERLVTNWGDPNGNIDSEYGRISRREWLNKEALRIGPRVEVLRSKSGKMALANK